MPSKSEAIMIVDDEVDNQRILQHYLESAGYATIIANDGVEAWELLTKCPTPNIRVILLDRMMPRMNGVELLKKIKVAAELKDIPVVMQTAAAEKAQVSEVLGLDVYHYLIKPFTKRSLLSVVEKAVDSIIPITSNN